MSDLLDIYCPQCNRLYQLTAEQVGPKGRKLRCSGCKFVFQFTPEPPPLDLVNAAPTPSPSPTVGTETIIGKGRMVANVFPTTTDRIKRRHKREDLSVRALFRLIPSGIELHGVTQDVSATGAYLSTNDPPSHEKSLKVGVTGVFELILLEGSQSAFIEMLGEVARMDEEGIGLRFLPESDISKTPNLSLPMSPFTPRPYAKVFVRRSSGALEGGWQILPNNAQLPATIARLFKEQREETLSVVCRKKTPSGDGFKIYSVKELKDIQQEAIDLGYLG